MVAGRSAWPEDGRGRRRRLRARRRHGVPGLRARAGRRARCRSAACRGRGSALSGSMRRARSSSGGACHDWWRRMMLRLVLWVLFRAVRCALSERRQLRVNRRACNTDPRASQSRHDLTDMLEMTEADAGPTVTLQGPECPSRKAAPCRNQVVDALRTGMARAILACNRAGSLWRRLRSTARGRDVAGDSADRQGAFADRETALGGGADLCLSKPFSNAELNAVVGWMARRAGSAVRGVRVPPGAGPRRAVAVLVPDAIQDRDSDREAEAENPGEVPIRKAPQ